MPSRYILLLILCCTALTVLLLRFVPASPPILTVPGYTLPAAEHTSTKNIRLRETTLDWLVMPVHQQSSKQLSALTETLGAGICAIDANQDGWIDLFFVGGSGHTRHYGRKSWWHKQSGNRLLLNHQGRFFTDVTDSVGLGEPHWGMGCTVADLDNDGWPDLMVTGVGTNSVYRNDNGERFINTTEPSGIAAEHWSTSASLADINADGLIDIYLSNYVAFNKGARTFERSKGFLTADVAFDASLYDPLPNKLYLNLGNFQFRDITVTAGVADNLGRSLGARWTDLNADQQLDLIVINDLDSPNQVYLNQGGLRFSRSESQYALLETPASRDIVEQDFNGDGINELLITQSSGLAPVLASRPSATAEKFSDHAWQAGIAGAAALNDMNWGATSGDYNNDGHADLFFANGHSNPDIDSPFVPQAQHNRLLLGIGDGSFISSDLSTTDRYPLSSRAAITADLNNDGRLDIIVSNNNDRLQIFESTGSVSGHWLGLDFDRENHAIAINGSSVSVTLDDAIIHRTLNKQQGFLSSGDHRLHIGLGDAAGPVDLSIDWPDGTQSQFYQVATDNYYAVNKAAGTIIPLPAITSTTPFKKPLDDLEDAARIKLGKLLLQQALTAENQPFTALWDSSNNTVKTALLAVIGRDWDPLYLRYLKSAVDSDSTEQQIAAIGVLKSIELEYSTPWLISLLAADSTEVSCVTARVLQFFFEEEEALTHRKYLAIAPLIRLLQSDSSEKVICAANALAAAENKRAVQPLIEQITNRSDVDVKVAAIRALGLIRDNESKVLLTSIINRPDSSSAIVVAEAFIALKRLNDPHIKSNFSMVFLAESSKDHTSMLQRYRILNALLNHSEAIVIQQQFLVELAAKMLANDALTDHPRSKNNPALTIEVLRTIKAARLTGHRTYVAAMSESDNAQVRTTAYQTLFQFDKNNTQRLLPTLLEQESAATIIDVLEETPRTTVSLQQKTLDKVINRLQSEDELSQKMPLLINALSSKSVAKLMAGLYTKKSEANQLQALLKVCASHGQIVSAALASVDKNKFLWLNYLYLYCQFGINIDQSGPVDYSLSDKLRLKRLLESQQYSKQEKHRLLLHAAKRDSVIANTLLLNEIGHYQGEDLLLAIEIFSQHEHNEKIVKFLRSELQQADAPMVIRLEAATQLLPIDRPSVLNYLNNEWLTDAPD